MLSSGGKDSGMQHSGVQAGTHSGTAHTPARRWNYCSSHSCKPQELNGGATSELSRGFLVLDSVASGYSSRGALPLLIAISTKLREAEAEPEGNLTWDMELDTVLPLLAAQGAAPGFQPLPALITAAALSAAALADLQARQPRALVLSGEACMEFMPALRHRPVLRGVCERECTAGVGR